MEQPKEIPIKNILKSIKRKNDELPLPLEMQVCALGFAMRLRELGVKQNSLFYWKPINLPSRKGKEPTYTVCDDGDEQCVHGHDESKWYSAFTVAELGVLMSDRWRTVKIAKRGWAHGRHGKGERIWGIFDSEADARASAVMGRLEEEMTKELLCPTI